MMCLRCKILVKQKLDALGMQYNEVDVGEVQLTNEPSDETLQVFKESLREIGLDLLEDKKAILVEKIQMLVIEMVNSEYPLPEVKYSVYISEKLNHNYTYLANLFSLMKGCTLEKFIILHKIERVKELILYHDFSLTKIAHQLRYSSVSHLSNQFKKETGLMPSFFKKIRNSRMNSYQDVHLNGL